MNTLSKNLRKFQKIYEIFTKKDNRNKIIY